MKKFFSLENLILLTIFLLPAYLIKLNLFGIPTNILEGLIIFILFFWLFRKNKKIKLILKENKAVFISTGIIFSGLIISAFVNPNYKAEWGIIKGWLFLPFLFAFIAQDVFASGENKNLFQAYFYSTFSVAIIALIYYFSGKLTFDGRLEVFFNSPNYLAMYLAPGFIIGIFKLIDLKNVSSLRESEATAAISNFSPGLLRFARNDISGFFHITALIIIGAVIYLTKSYAGWFSLFLAILLTAIFIYRKRLKKYLFLGIVLFLAVIYFQFQTVKFGDLINASERSSLSSRIAIWQSAGKILADNWPWGIGPGNFQDKYLEYQKYFPPYLEWAVPHPHSLYLNIWLSGGILGLAGFFSLIFFWTKSFWKKENKESYIWILGIMLYILLHGLFDATYFKNDLSVVFWLVILTGASLKENKQSL